MNIAASNPAAPASILSGVFSVVPTPFDADGTIDYEGIAPLVEFLLGKGVAGLTALGVTSETGRLTDAERNRVLEHVARAVGGRARIVVGATADGLHPCIDFALRAKGQGAAAVMVGPPKMGRPSPRAIVSYFTALAEAADIDIVLQDYPAVSGFAMDVDLLVRLAREIPRIRAIKLEDPPTAPKLAALKAAAGDTPIAVFGGLGGAFLFEELLAGGTGAMTGFAYPEVLTTVVRLFQAGRIEAAADAFYRYTPVLRLEAQEGIGMAIRKELLHRRGVLANPALRAPAPSLDPATVHALNQALAWTGLVDPEGGNHPWN